MGDDFIIKIQILEEKNSFYFITFNFFKSFYYSINLKRQSGHSGFRPDTSSLVTIDLQTFTDQFYSKCLTRFCQENSKCFHTFI